MCVYPIFLPSTRSEKIACSCLDEYHELMMIMIIVVISDSVHTTVFLNGHASLASIIPLGEAGDSER